MTDTLALPIERDELVERQVPRHVAIIMDGNGRWAKERGMPRVEGHRKGVDAVRTVTRVAAEYGVEYLTLYSFSSENWNRPESEISELFGLLRLFIRKHLVELHQNNVRLQVIGEETGLPDDINVMIKEAIELTKGNDGLTLIVAFNYGARGEIAKAMQAIAKAVLAGEISPDDVTADLVDANLQTSGVPDPDLIIRTSGEQRLSNFLLWQAAYSELVFKDCKWPDFNRQSFLDAMEEYFGRERRFGAVSSATKSG